MYLLVAHSVLFSNEEFLPTQLLPILRIFNESERGERP